VKTLKKILVGWVLLGGMGFVLLRCLPNDEPSWSSVATNSLLILAGLVCVVLFVKDPIKTNKPIYLNFAAFFCLSMVAFAYSFIPASATSRLQFFVFQYHQLAYFFLLAFSVVYVVTDSLFNDFKLPSKYLVTFGIVAATFSYYYSPIIQNPAYLSSTQDVRDFNSISRSKDKLEQDGRVEASAAEIAMVTNLGIWRDGKQIAVLFDEQKVRRVEELLPYRGNNFACLYYKPLFLSNISMNVLCVVFVFLFFGFKYKNDPPQGAYIEKIIFLFLPYCSLEILHHYAYIKSVEYGSLLDVQEIGGYLTLVNLVLLLVFFSLRLRFITSVKGEFYERELVSDAEHISRWRDAFDNLVVRHFLNPKAVHGRLFAPRSPGGEA